MFIVKELVSTGILIKKETSQKGRYIDILANEKDTMVKKWENR
jgi:hypothetical protein